MSKEFLEEKKFFAYSETGAMWYQVRTCSVWLRNGIIDYDLELVCGWDYISEDHDKTGWCPKENFSEEYQDDTVLQYFLEEGMKEAFEANDWKVVEWEKAPTEVRKLAETKQE